MYKTLGAKCLFETFCPASAFATADRDEARNPQRFIHVSVACKCKKTDTTDNLLHNEKKILPQNSTFANRTGQHLTKICKRAVFCNRTQAHPPPKTQIVNRSVNKYLRFNIVISIWICIFGLKTSKI
jgi:hypothetical protein